MQGWHGTASHVGSLQPLVGMVQSWFGKVQSRVGTVQSRFGAVQSQVSTLQFKIYVDTIILRSVLYNPKILRTQACTRSTQ